MTFPHRPVPLRPATEPEPVRPWTVTPAGQPPRAMLLTRRYEVLWLDDRGTVAELTRVAPAMPAFERAFAAFARGSLIATSQGPVAIEDLLPGTMVQTRSGPQPVRWIGRIVLPPANLKQDSGPDIFRIGADTFGGGRPMPDVVLCSGARLLHRASRLAALKTGPDVLVPVADFADGVHVTQIGPMSAVTAYHLALDQHAAIEVNGLTVESCHPCRDSLDGLTGDLLALFLSLFPYLHDFRGFGALAYPRLGLEAIEAMVARA